LEILKAKGLVSCRRVGNAKLWQPTVASLTICPLIPEDLPALLEIQKQIQPTQDEAACTVFAQTMEHHIKTPSLQLGAEQQGELVGFIVGELRAWEFGVGEQTGWIKVLAVAPEYQRRGIGWRLGEALLRQLRQRGICRVRTLVDSYSGELIAYFQSVGFQILNMIPLKTLCSTPKIS
jgi:ribosomal protein S18 acetylase RimI-like enzyme